VGGKVEVKAVIGIIMKQQIKRLYMTLNNHGLQQELQNVRRLTCSINVNKISL